LIGRYFQTAKSESMHHPGNARTASYSLLRNRLLRQWSTDIAGATAIEFGIVAIPFLMFIMGLIGCAFFFFVTNSIEKGMDQTSRLIRTGEAVADKMTVNDFKDSICDGAGFWIRCKDLQIFVKSYTAGWGELAQDKPQPCVDANGVIQTNPAPGTDLIAIYSGAASDVVVVTACYKWTLTAKLPLFKIGNMSDGSMMLQSATAFRSEPYPQG
jgi:Flp pilus assembly protein TadG